MTKRKYKRLIKNLEKIYEQIRNNQPNYKIQGYANVKVKLYLIIKALDDNKPWWCE